MNQKLLCERRFTDVRQMIGDLQTMLAIANLRWTDVCYVKTFTGDGGYATIARLWEETLTDNSKVYELHLL